MSASATVFLIAIGVGVPVLAYSGKRKLDAGLVVPRLPVYLEGIVTQMFLLALSFYVASANGIELLSAPEPTRRELALAGAVLLAAIGAMILATRFARTETLERILMIVPDSFGERLVWILVSAAAAFGEELTYRGVLFGLLARQLENWWLCAMLGALIFAAAHIAQGWSSAVVIMAFGVAFQYLARETGSLLLPVIVHFLYDVATGLYLAGRRDHAHV